MCSWSRSSTGWRATSRTWLVPCRTCRIAEWGFVCWPIKVRGSTPAGGRLVFGIFGACRVRARTHPRAYGGGAEGGAGAGPQRRPEVRAIEGASAVRAGGDGEPGFVGGGTMPGAWDWSRDALPVRGRQRTLGGERGSACHRARADGAEAREGHNDSFAARWFDDVRGNRR